MTIRVLIADDQAMIRGGLRLILEDQPDIAVVAEAADGTEAIRLARQFRPDVCLVDIRMPGKDGLEVTRAVAGPGVADPLRVVIVTTFARRSGASVGRRPWSCHCLTTRSCNWPGACLSAAPARARR